MLVPTYALADGEVASTRVRFFQVYDVEMSGLENTFTYLIEPQEPDAPLPSDDEGNPLRQFSMRRDEELWLEFHVPVSVSESASELRYHYILRPERTSLADGLFYVDAQSTNLAAGVNVYYLEIYVRLSNEDASAAIVVPTVHIEGFDGEKVTDPGWRISYKDVKEDDSRETDDRPGTVIPRYPSYLRGAGGVGGFTYRYDRNWYDESSSGDGSTSSGSSSATGGSTSNNSSGGAPSGSDAGANAGAAGQPATGTTPSDTGAATSSPAAPSGAATEGANIAAGAVAADASAGASKDNLASTADVQDNALVRVLLGLAVTLIMPSFVLRYQKGR